VVARARSEFISILVLIVIVLALRLPFMNQSVQGDDLFYLYGAEHAQIDPWHPTHVSYLFRGDVVTMQGQSHGPLNTWILAALLAVLHDVREVPFHLAYALFSVIAALAMWSLAKRFTERPMLATFLFLAVPAFVVNGNTLESDLPFLAFWMSAIALFVRAVDDHSVVALIGAAITSALAGLAAYQAIFLVPILGFYLIEKRNRWPLAWVVAIAAPMALFGAWQLFERSTSGQLPAAVLAGYMQSYQFRALPQELRNAAALLVHSGWILSPVLVLAAFTRGPKWRWIAAALAAGAAAIYDPHPMFWASAGCGVLLLAWCFGRGFVGAWVLLFFAGALMVFFAGSARYLLPMAAPVAILAARATSTRTVALGLALQLPISLALAVVNYQHADVYRQFAASLSNQIATHRVWIDSDWGLCFYLESEGALPMPKNQVLQPGDMVVGSDLTQFPINQPVVPFMQAEIRPKIPLRLISVDGRSAYSVASPGRIEPFEFSTAPIDHMHASIVTERKLELSYVDPHDTAQIVSGLYPDGWMTDQATVLLKRPEHSMPLRADLYIPPATPARHVRMLVDGVLAAEETFAGPGSYRVAVPMPAGIADVTVTLTVDQTFSAPGDQRKLGVIVTGVGFR
jgi:hypothetical protein